MNKFCHNILYNIYDNLQTPAKNVMQRIIDLSDDINQVNSKNIFIDSPIDIAEVHPLETRQNECLDLRVKYITLNGFRTYPEHEPPFGLLLADEEGNACSGFFLAANGVGKTTIYSALQKVYLGRISNDVYNNLSAEDKIKYEEFGLHEINIKGKKEDAIKIISASDSPIKPCQSFGEVLSPFFISDEDITALQKADLSEYILSQLGYYDIIHLRAKLNNILLEYKQLSKNKLSKEDIINIASFTLEHANDTKLNETILERTKLKEDISNFWLSDGFPTLLPQWRKEYRNQKEQESQDTDKADAANGGISAVFEVSHTIAENILFEAFNLIKDWLTLINSGEDNSPKVLKEVIEKYESAVSFPLNSERDVSDRQKILYIIIRALNEQIIKIEERFYDIKDFIAETLSDFSDTDDNIVEFNFEKVENDIDKIYVNIQVNKGKSKFNASPKLYYNTFRFKLYAVALKIALAFHTMREYNINVPIVIDDVFSASDFDNTLRLSKFVRQIYDTYEQKVGFTTPLQLILFTHDDGILQTFAQASYGHKYIEKRIFSYKDVESEADCVKETQNNGKFINLYL